MRIVFVFLSLIFTHTIFAQNTFKAIVKDSKTHEKLIGATAYIKNLKLGASTDTSGLLVINNIPNGSHEIVCSYIGYEKKEVEFLFPLPQTQGVEILLSSENAEIKEIVVTSTRTNSRIEDIPIRIDVIGQEEVNEEVNVKPANISKLLLESPSVQVQQTSAMNGTVNIRLQGLDGRYTQILKDGFPLYGGLSQDLSIMQIPPLDLKQVEVIKGSASSLYGSDAIAGIINLISNQPQKKRDLTFLINQTSLLGTDANGYFAQRWKRMGFSFLTANNFQMVRDINHDGFSDLPKTRTFNLIPTLYYYIDPTTTLSLSLNGTYDDRKGGDMKVLKNQSDVLHSFFEESVSRHISSQFRFDKQFGPSKLLTIKNSLSDFSRSVNEPNSSFAGNQRASYTEAAFNFKAKKQELVIGINLITDKFLEDSTKSHVQRNYTYSTLGVFLQDDWKPIEKFSLQAGLRSDYQNRYGYFVLPRLAIMYKFNSNFYVRAGSGFGYKTPSIFSTESEVGLNNIRPLSSNVKAETSMGGNLDFNYKIQSGDEGFVTLNQSFFVTQIENPLILDTIQFTNKSKPINTAGFESNVRYRLDEFQVFVGYTLIDARRRYNWVQSFIPLTPRHKVNLDIIYEKEDSYSIALEGYYVSSMFRDFDTKTKEYFTFGLIAQKHFKNFTIVVNCENLFDIRQTRFEDIVILPINAPSFRQIYAPLEGRVFNVALRINV